MPKIKAVKIASIGSKQGLQAKRTRVRIPQLPQQQKRFQRKLKAFFGFGAFFWTKKGSSQKKESRRFATNIRFSNSFGRKLF